MDAVRETVQDSSLVLFARSTGPAHSLYLSILPLGERAGCRKVLRISQETDISTPKGSIEMHNSIHMRDFFFSLS